MIWLAAVTIAHNFIPHFTDKQKSVLAYLASLISQFPVGPLLSSCRYFSSSCPTSSPGSSPLFHCQIEGPGNEAAFVPRNGPTSDWRMRLVSNFSFLQDAKIFAPSSPLGQNPAGAKTKLVFVKILFLYVSNNSNNSK